MRNYIFVQNFIPSLHLLTQPTVCLLQSNPKPTVPTLIGSNRRFDLHGTCFLSLKKRPSNGCI